MKDSGAGDVMFISGGISSKVTSLTIFDVPLLPAISIPSIFIS